MAAAQQDDAGADRPAASAQPAGGPHAGEPGGDALAAALHAVAHAAATYQPPPPAVTYVPPPPPPPPAPSPPPLDLVGIVTSGSTKLALLRDRGTGEVHRLSAGEDYDGWSIEFVDTRSVAFHNGEQTETLTMFEQLDTPPPDGLPPGFLPLTPEPQ